MRIFFALTLLCFELANAAVPDFCAMKSCVPVVSARPELASICNEGQISNRCCISNGTVIGVDLSNCDINAFDVLQLAISGMYQPEIQLILMDSNNITIANDEAFYNYTSLNYVTVPLPLKCPGDAYQAWNMTKNDTKLDATVCQTQVTYCERHNDACIELSEYPNNAYCVPRGPSLFECPCSPGVYGYKCLRRGEFPTAIFAPVVTISTVLLSGFLWYTQRRHVIAPPNGHSVHQQ